ncbi:P-loop containing nucleoside triphosphate hydrolase protein [Talaromyces proteolyticus]|uniref:P-loop containing nucleoside triphosphate hydrolase protein n=1 Tax=Talaromyces proteolyticus TaxID=1131652 RepID=A0AAD4KF10_9EURO|nr:P-loop containing nucleoside triphosphate hydrolase protein [Talaromyces proteolyticus]KAH8689380.1 P-loop containing nucleoside triphosphate hydrolase protein [Talaromyces proteolyticus]
MEILVLGLCRTGTQSLADALILLGYRNVYHMREVVTSDRDHRQHWIKAIDAKYEGKGRPYGRVEYDEFLGNFAALTDIPAAMFPEELITAYPSAKVILTTRDEEGWYKSMENTIWHAWYQGKSRSPDGAVKNPMISLSDKFHGHLWKSNFEADGRKCFRDHNEKVKQLMSKHPSNFLVYNVKEGWDSLCQFLGKEIPDHEFPRNDHWIQYKNDNCLSS